MSDFSLKRCSTQNDYEIAKLLTKDYMVWLGIDLCFQNIDDEFENFEQMYGYPHGCFIYIDYNGIVAGGVGLRVLKKGVCEMKRLFVYDDFRGQGFGEILCKSVIEKARNLGYDKMVLDTVRRLEAANSIYEKMGFKDIPSYYDNPEETARYMGINL
tara:strand:- start:50 stop:520 length:471 start_codon:yes stop_codon:yes gene_type:complete